VDEEILMLSYENTDENKDAETTTMEVMMETISLVPQLLLLTMTVPRIFQDSR
jgi:hypothetical protein